MPVDTALVTLVLPRAEDAARDMGVLSMANAGPQIIAPLAPGRFPPGGGPASAPAGVRRGPHTRRFLRPSALFAGLRP
ncbi:hypothetical protein ACGFYU_11255 [Streptomyces sp. NPDC048337]|uniref:hypothetical protein n=1 Tax=Streptomyces sp. NPDC048337 TaxID=3365535 RepID=UPI00371D26E4